MPTFMSRRTRAPRRPLAALAVTTATLLFAVTPTRAGADPWADAVLDFDPGLNGNPSYADPLATLGSPERFTGEGIFEGVVSPFNPAWGTDELFSMGREGFLVVHFAEAVVDDPANPHGIDLIVFGNAGFLDAAYPQGIVGGLLGADGGRIEVKRLAGDDWVEVEGATADGLLPTLGFLDSGPYDAAPGTVESDFTRPVDPALGLEDFVGLDHEQVVALYAGSGGGAGIDLAPTGLAEVHYVRISNAADAIADIEIDGFADVAPAGSNAPGDVDGDGIVGFLDLLAVLAEWGPCPADPLPCPADANGSGAVDFEDLLLVLANWSS